MFGIRMKSMPKTCEGCPIVCKRYSDTVEEIQYHCPITKKLCKSGYVNDNCPIKEEPDFYYLAYFYINSDGDFYVKKYLGMNDEYRLFLNINDAIDTIKKHFKTAIDSIKSEKHTRVKEYWEKLYNDPATWTNWLLDGGDELFNISEDLGNYGVEYSIRRVKFFEVK